MKFRKKKKISVLIYLFKGIPGFYRKFQAISRVQGAKINSMLFKGLEEPWEHCIANECSTGGWCALAPLLMNAPQVGGVH